MEKYSQNRNNNSRVSIYLNPALVALVCLIIISICYTPAFSTPNEYEIKAAFLYNFANFIDWPAHTPADSTGALVIGVYGDDPFGNVLERTVTGKAVNGRRIEIKRFRSIHELKPCHILFISSSEEGHCGRIFNAVKDWHVLTVGETDGFARNGGVINFFTDENKIRFEINPDNARKTGLKVSSKLLKLAKVVRG